MPFKRLCTGKVLAFRFQFPSCHNHRPYDPKDTPAARVFDTVSVQSLDPTHHRVPSSLAGAPRPSGCHREPLLVLVDVAPQCTVRGQPSQIVVMGRLVFHRNLWLVCLSSGSPPSKRGLAGTAVSLREQTLLPHPPLPALGLADCGRHTFENFHQASQGLFWLLVPEIRHSGEGYFIYRPRKPLPRPPLDN